MITFIQARVPRTSNSKHYQQKAHFCVLSLCTDVPPPSEKKSGEEILFSEGGGTSVHRLCDLRLYKRTLYESFKQGVGGRCLQGNLWYSPPASMTSRLASLTLNLVALPHSNAVLGIHL